MKQTITACVLLHHEGKALIGKRAETKQFFPGKWELPGGHVEWGETVEQSLKRELLEEFGIDIALEKIYHEFTWIGEDEHVIEVLYTAHLIDPNQKIIMNADELSDYKWITQSEIDTYFVDNNDPEKLAVQKGFQALIS